MYKSQVNARHFPPISLPFLLSTLAQCDAGDCRMIFGCFSWLDYCGSAGKIVWLVKGSSVAVEAFRVTKNTFYGDLKVIIL